MLLSLARGQLFGGIEVRNPLGSVFDSTGCLGLSLLVTFFAALDFSNLGRKTHLPAFVGRLGVELARN